ncbi:MAG: diguanylate cyclase [Acidobacteria bacterium]|nr:diguanylate cyclase [Acidobacteriota bacterium]
MRILIADDEIVSRKLLTAVLRQMGHEVVSARDGAEAWQLLQRETIGLVIADWMMPRMDGLELIRRIRSAPDERDEQHYIYVILLTGRTDRQDIIRGLQAGADDYITKPFDRDELIFRIRAGERVLDLERKLAQQNRILQTMALIDGLTAIGNRRAFDEQLRQVFELGRRFGRQFSVAMIDIDHFKRYNDALGHEAGDGALRAVAQVLAETIRTSDQVFRYGGEEFACLFGEIGPAGAQTAAERLREAVETAGIPHPDNPPLQVVTVSVGHASYLPGAPGGAEQVVRAADQALYAAKNAGRNRTAGASLPEAEPAGAARGDSSGGLP